MIAVCAATDRELAGLERRLKGVEPVHGDGHRVRRGYLAGDVLTCRTGIGRRAEDAGRALIQRHRPLALLSVGLCGALDPDLGSGGLVLCESVTGGSADGEQIDSDGGLLRRAEAAAGTSGLPVRRGRALTVDRVVGAADKERLRRSTGLDIVEMESFWLAGVARDEGTAFLAVRAVLDGATESVPLPEDLALRADGSVRLARVVAYAISHPGSLGHLISTARAERQAVDSLTRFLEAFIATMQASPVLPTGEAA